MGPLAFLIYVNDLAFNDHRGRYVLLADDTRASVAADGFQQGIDWACEMQSEVELWLRDNGSILNLKTQLTL